MAVRAKGKSRVASLDPIELIASARRGEPVPLVVVTGRDYFSRDAILDELRRALVTEGFEVFNYAALSGEEVSGSELADQADMMAMGGGCRHLLVRRAEKIREKEVEPLLKYAASPAPSSCVVFVFEELKGAAWTGLGKMAPGLDFPAPRDYQLARWLDAQARRLKVALEPDAAKLLAEISGEDHVGAFSDLQRAALAAGGGRITRKTIAEIIARGRDTNVFHLTDAVMSREPVRALKILRDLHEGGSTGYSIIGLLESQLRKFLKMRAKMAGGAPARGVVQAESPMLPPDVKSRLVRQLETFNERRLMDAFAILRVADRAIKSTGSGSELAHMESLVWRISSL